MRTSTTWSHLKFCTASDVHGLSKLINLLVEQVSCTYCRKESWFGEKTMIVTFPYACLYETLNNTCPSHRIFCFFNKHWDAVYNLLSRLCTSSFYGGKWHLSDMAFWFIEFPQSRTFRGIAKETNSLSHQYCHSKNELDIFFVHNSDILSNMFLKMDKIHATLRCIRLRWQRAACEKWGSSWAYGFSLAPCNQIKGAVQTVHPDNWICITNKCSTPSKPVSKYVTEHHFAVMIFFPKHVFQDSLKKLYGLYKEKRAYYKNIWQTHRRDDDTKNTYILAMAMTKVYLLPQFYEWWNCVSR